MTFNYTKKDHKNSIFWLTSKLTSDLKQKIFMRLFNDIIWFNYDANLDLRNNIIKLQSLHRIIFSTIPFF